MHSYDHRGNGRLGCFWGFTKIVWRGLMRPAECEPGDRLLSYGVWLVMLGCFGSAGYYLLGPAEKHEPLTIASYGVGACGVALAVFLGTRGRSVEEVLDELEDK